MSGFSAGGLVSVGFSQICVNAIHSVYTRVGFLCIIGLQVGSCRGGFSAGGQGWLSVKYCRWLLQRWLSVTAKHSTAPQTYSPTPALFPAPGSTVPHSKVNNPILYSKHPQHAWNSRRTISRIFPIFHQIFHESSEEVQEEENFVKVEQNRMDQVALSGVPARSNHCCKI